MSMQTTKKLLTGAQIFMESLRSQGVDTIFGYPGAIILSIYEELYHCEDIKHYLVRHEQAAAHAAEGYARVKNKPGVVLVTSGPGATNTITGITNAYLDGYPMVVFTGQVPSHLIGKDAFQEANIVDMTKSCTKKNYLVTDVNELRATIKEAFEIANSGKKGPVVIDIAKNVLEAKAEYKPIVSSAQKTIAAPDSSKIKQAVELIQNANKPVIIAGGGVVAADANIELTDLAKKLNIPVVNTLMGLGSYPLEDDNALGMMGMFGTAKANEAIRQADLILAIGVRFSERITNPFKDFSKGKKLIHIDIDSKSISKNIPADIEIISDAKEALKALLKEIKSQDSNSWHREIKTAEQDNLVNDYGKLNADIVLKKVYEFTKKYDPIVATEVGQHQMWTAKLFKFKSPRKFLTSGGLGTMGFGFPAAIGAYLADSTRPVLNIAGDGSIQMNIQELATCMEYKIPVKTIILNNSYLGMVRQQQQKLFNENYSGTEISGPDFVKVAEAYGAKGIRVEREEDVIPALEEMMKFDGPVFVDFVIEPFEVV